MSKPLIVTIPHQLGAAEARRRLEHGLSDARQQLEGRIAHIEERWEGDHMTFLVKALGQSVSGRIDVHDDHARVEVRLPWLLARLARTITDRVQHRGTLLLGRK